MAMVMYRTLPPAIGRESTENRTKEKDHAVYLAQPSFSNTFTVPIIGSY